MTAPAAIQGTFADLKTVKTRSVVQMIIEVPIEQGKQVVDAFGFPQPGSEIPVAVARMNPALDKVQDRPTTARKPATTRAEKARRMCGVPAFQDWLMIKFGVTEEWIVSESRYDTTSGRVKRGLLINSKTEIDNNATAAKLWDEWMTEYEQATGRMAQVTR